MRENMEYTKGRIGRVFTVRIDHGDDLIKELIKLAELERIESAFFTLLGALKEGKLVTGPKESIVPPEPVWSGFDDVHEILGISFSRTENRRSTCMWEQVGEIVSNWGV
jgi:predicted DNA-binding protein with PD1-like motif